MELASSGITTNYHAFSWRTASTSGDTSALTAEALLGLTGLPMHGVAATPAAVLLQLETILGVGLVLGGDVVPPLALGAGESHWRSFCRWHFRYSFRMAGKTRPTW